MAWRDESHVEMALVVFAGLQQALLLMDMGFVFLGENGTVSCQVDPPNWKNGLHSRSV